MSLPVLPATKWHYVVDYVDDMSLSGMTKFFRQHGNLGLELVSFNQETGLAVFKQPINDT